MKNMFSKLLILCICVTLVGCATPPNNQDVGTITGGVLGGLIGSRFGGGEGQLLAVGAGALAGAYIGGQIGRTMDAQDRARMYAAFENNANGQPAYWRNAHTGATYDVVPQRNVTIDGNPYCREFRQKAYIAGKKQQIYGTACRQPDGTWQVVNS